jgi:hypothetical protein
MKEDHMQIREKNLEKMKDIEYLEKQNEKLKQQLESVKDEKNRSDKRLVNTEVENSDFFNKARELECWAEELKTKLEAALEENIILHNEHDTFKYESEEQIQRLQEEIEELKNEVTSKDKIIQRLTMHRDFILKTAFNASDDVSNNVLNSKQFQLLKNSSSGKINVITPVNKNKKIPEKFMQSYSKSFLNIQGDEEGGENVGEDAGYILNNERNDEIKHLAGNKKGSQEKETIENIDGNNYIRKENRRLSAKQVEKFLGKASFAAGSFLYQDLDQMEENEDEEEKEFIKQKIDLEIKNIIDSRRIFILNTLIQENFSFDYSGGQFVEGSCEKKQSSFKGQQSNPRLVENIDELLQKIQQRKEKILLQKKLMQSKLEKVGIKLC